MKFTKIITKNDYDFLQKRHIFFADGPEGMGPDEGGEGGGGVSEEAAERAAEERRQSAKAAKKQKKEEKKVKKREHRLANIIREFIQGAKRDDKMALLLSRLLQRNTPAAILLAVLSLVHHEVIEELENYLEDEQDILPDDSPFQEESEESRKALVQYGKELSQALSVWTKRIFIHASFRPMKAILSLAHHHGVDHNIVQLTSLMISKYFKEKGQDVEGANIHQFSELFWRNALKRLHFLADERGLLPEPNNDPMEDEDEDE